jgi:hypothetical protein
MLRRFESLLAVALAGILAGGGCTHWGTVNVYGQKQEVGRQLTGAPQVAETSSSNMSANFFATKGQTPVTGADAAAGNAFASTDSQKRMHCVQQAQIQYVQPYEIRPETQGRVWDVVGGIVLGGVGLSFLSSAAVLSQPSADPYATKPNVTPYYVIGGVALAGAAAWLIYSFHSLPSGPPPPVQTSQQRWTATEYVEAVGCGLVPGDPVLAAPAPPPPAPAPYTQAPAPPPPAPAPYTQASAPPPPAPATAPAQSGGGKKQEGDVAARLQKLEKLHKAGLLTDEEYKRKRKEMVDGL